MVGRCERSCTDRSLVAPGEGRRSIAGLLWHQRSTSTLPGTRTGLIVTFDVTPLRHRLSTESNLGRSTCTVGLQIT
jgi:hypothetical protein